MRTNDFEERLKQTLHQSPAMINAKHLEATLLLAGKEVCRKQKRERISFTRFLFMQIKFIGWQIWGMQFLCLLPVSGIMFCLYDGLNTPQFMVKILFCLSVMVFMTALPFLYRSTRYQMQEIEATTRFSSVKLLLAKFAVIGMGDVFMLGSIFFIVMMKTSLQADRAVLYLCVPFLLIGSGCLFMLGHFTPKHFFIGSMGLCTFAVLMFSVIPGQYEWLFQQSFSVRWLAVCVLLIAFCICQFRYILCHSSYTEMQLV